VVTEILSLKEEVRTKTVLFLWKWWTERNKINKGEKGQGVDGVAADELNLLNDLSKLERKEPIRQTAGNARWKAPPPGQLMINSVQEMMQGSWGFTVRDYEGEVVLAGAGRLRSIPDSVCRGFASGYRSWHFTSAGGDGLDNSSKSSCLTIHGSRRMQNVDKGHS